MTYAIVSLVAFLFYYSLRQYRFYLFRKYELRLYLLRDKLRDLAIESKIDKNDWTFKYFDSSISKMITTFHEINLYHALFLMKSHNHDHRFNEFKKHLDTSLSKNSYLGELNKEYVQTLNEYLIHRHLLLILITGLGVKSAITSINVLKGFVQDTKSSIKNLSIFPETSTSMEYSKVMRSHTA